MIICVCGDGKRQTQVVGGGVYLQFFGGTEIEIVFNVDILLLLKSN